MSRRTSVCHICGGAGKILAAYDYIRNRFLIQNGDDEFLLNEPNIEYRVVLCDVCLGSGKVYWLDPILNKQPLYLKYEKVNEEIVHVNTRN